MRKKDVKRSTIMMRKISSKATQNALPDKSYTQKLQRAVCINKASKHRKKDKISNFE